MRSELRDALRSLARDRSFTLMVVLLLALTIGVTTAVYAIVDAVMLRPVAMAAQDRTVVIWQRDLTRNAPVVEVALGEVDSWRRHSATFGALAVFGSVNWSLAVVNGDVRTGAPYASVSASFFEIAGTPPMLGRVLDATDELGNEPRTAVISDRFWKQRLGADPQIIGRTIQVQDDIDSPVGSLEIVGVMPAAFDFPQGAMLWLPARPGIRAAAHGNADPDEYLAHLRVFYALGRLRDGVTRTQAQQELDGIIRQTAETGRTGAPPDAVVMAIDDFLLGPAKPVLWTMLAGAALMVLLACASVAGLHLFRFARHDRALAIQLALGASLGRLVRRSAIESALLAGASTAGAAGVAWTVTRLLVLAAPLDLPRLTTARVGAPAVLIIMAALAALASVLSGAWPILFISHVDAGRTLVCGSRTAMHPRDRSLQRLVVGSQVAVAVVLLSGAALFVRSVQRLDRTALGFIANGLLSIGVESSAKDLDRSDHFYDELLARTAQLRQVTSAGAVYLRPLSGPIGDDTIPVLEGQAGLSQDAAWRSNPLANLEAVTPGYFRTLGTRLLAGRDFTRDDRASSPGVVIVSASAARRYWPGRDPIGQRILVATQRTPGSREEPRWQTVVGVVEDVRYRGIRDPRLDLYLPAAQSTARVKYLVARAKANPGHMAAEIRAIARELDPAVHVGEIATMGELVAREGAPWRFAMRVLTASGIVAAVLATVGLIGLISLVVSLRHRELGIRAALGATPGRLRAHVLAEAFVTTGAGTVAGLLGALALGRLAGGLLVETSAHDPLSLMAAGALTLLAGLSGCLIPAQRAAASDPAEALRG